MFPYLEVTHQSLACRTQGCAIVFLVSDGISVCCWSCPIAFQECRNDHGTGRFRQPSLSVFAPEYINPVLLQSASELCTALHEHAIPEMVEELHVKTGSRHRPRWEWGQSASPQTWPNRSLPEGYQCIRFVIPLFFLFRGKALSGSNGCKLMLAYPLMVVNLGFLQRHPS